MSAEAPVKDYSQIYDYANQPKDHTPVCNLCGNGENFPQPIDDRFGFRIGAVVCKECGLAYITPRLTKEAYAQFYCGPYRALVSLWHGREINAETLQPEQREYAQSIAAFLTPHIHDGHKTLLDIGGSTGIVARYLCNRFELRGTVIDPSPAELRVAKEKQLDTIAGVIESYEIPEKWDVITLCQTVDHLLDITGTLAKIKKHLGNDGVLFVDILDFEVSKLWKIDHPFNLTQNTIERYLRQGGFVIADKERNDTGTHVRYIAKVA